MKHIFLILSLSLYISATFASEKKVYIGVYSGFGRATLPDNAVYKGMGNQVSFEKIDPDEI